MCVDVRAEQIINNKSNQGSCQLILEVNIYKIFNLFSNVEIDSVTRKVRIFWKT